MTFEKFQQLAKANCPNVEWVSKHGDYSKNPSKNTLGVKFKNNPKVYDYHGSYFEILRQLGFICTTQYHINSVTDRLAYLTARHGKKGLFGVIDNTEAIQEYTEMLNELKAMPIVE